MKIEWCFDGVWQKVVSLHLEQKCSSFKMIVCLVESSWLRTTEALHWLIMGLSLVRSHPLSHTPKQTDLGTSGLIENSLLLEPRRLACFFNTFVGDAKVSLNERRCSFDMPLTSFKMRVSSEADVELALECNEELAPSRGAAQERLKIVIVIVFVLGIE
jgi:hypothetical protein